MLELRDVCKSYEGKPLLEGISLRVDEGETLCLLGPSGSGKSTLLRIAAGLETPDRGRVFWNGREITQMPAHNRGFGLMFQDYALFPHLNVAENVAFGLRMQSLPDREIRPAVRDALARVNLGGYERRRVAELSGGEQQRVALARALAPRPSLIMLDEPLGALDRALREELIGEIRRGLHSMRIPSVYVTHDQEEAFAVATRVAVLHAGRILQTGSPEDLIARPASTWIARFLGLGNILPGRVRRIRPLRIETSLGEFPADDPVPPVVKESEGWILLRPGGGALDRQKKAATNGIRGVVRECVRLGDGYRLLLESGTRQEVVCSSPEPFCEGDELIWIPAKGVWIGM